MSDNTNNTKAEVLAMVLGVVCAALVLAAVIAVVRQFHWHH